MSLLTMVGSRLIPPSTIAELLDIEKTPRKPSYTTCSAVNLTLVDTQYEDNEPHWRSVSCNRDVFLAFVFESIYMGKTYFQIFYWSQLECGFVFMF